MYEHLKQPLVAHTTFLVRIVKSFFLAFVLISISMCIGMSGYHFIEDIPWISAYQEAAMILSGMGPIISMHSDAGKIFAGTYALYSGLMFVVSIGVIIAPIVHRFYHKFHLDMGKS